MDTRRNQCNLYFTVLRRRGLFHLGSHGRINVILAKLSWGPPMPHYNVIGVTAVRVPDQRARTHTVAHPPTNPTDTSHDVQNRRCCLRNDVPDDRSTSGSAHHRATNHCLPDLVGTHTCIAVWVRIEHADHSEFTPVTVNPTSMHRPTHHGGIDRDFADIVCAKCHNFVPTTFTPVTSLVPSVASPSRSGPNAPTTHSSVTLSPVTVTTFARTVASPLCLVQATLSAVTFTQVI